LAGDASKTQARTLDEANELIATLSEQVVALERRQSESRLADELRDAFGLAAAVNVMATRVSHTRQLEMIVNTGARVIGATAASLFLLDKNAAELIFEVAIGPMAEQAKQFRVPLGQGIVGLVAVTGQPMVISNVEQDPRHASHIAESIGYTPKSILCVPLIVDGEVIGVFELLDREDGSSFTPADIELLGEFANQAAVAIEQSDAFRSLVPLIGRVFEELGLIPREQQGVLRERAEAFARNVEETRSFKQTLELAHLVHEIAGQGESEFKVCQQILESFASYLRGRRAWSDHLGGR
jgi:GAF domain-containing protein